MSRLDDFLNKNKEEVPDMSAFEKLDKRYPCQHCNRASVEAYFDERAYVIHWVCPNNHLSSVRIDGKNV
jgi:hypothetical protein